MTQLYARIFTQILDSSLSENWQARHVFEDMLKLSEDGVLDITREALSRRTNVPIEIINEAIAYLEAPDLTSRDAADEGRRLARIDEHRDWGWIIVNWDKYEAVRSKLESRQKTAERVKRYRARKNGKTLPPFIPSLNTDSDSDSEDALPNCNTALHSVTVTQKTADAVPTSKLTDEAWIRGLKEDQAYKGIEVEREYAKMIRWCEVSKKQPSRRRFINWLNRAEKPMQAQLHHERHTTWELSKKIEAFDAEMKEIKDRGSEFAMGWQADSDKDRLRLAALKKLKRTLQQQMNQ